MTTNVNFRVDVTGAPAAKGQVKGVRDELNATRDAATNSARARSAGYRRAEDDINRARGLAVQQEIQAQRRQVEAGRAALQQRLADYKRSKAEEAREAEKARREELAKERQHHANIKRQRAEMMRQQRDAQANSGLGILAGQGAVGGAVGAVAGKVASDVKGQFTMLSNAGVDAVKSYAEFESLKINLEMLFKSTKDATRALNEMKAMSLKTGIGVDKFAQAAATMSGFGVQADLIIPKLSQIAVIAKGDAEAMQRLGRAYGQAYGLGRLQAEERNQMIDAGFNPMLQIAKDTGKTMQQLTKDMANGKISVDLLTAAFDNAVAKGGQFEGGMEAMATKTQVQINRLTESFKDLYRASGEALSKGGAMSAVGIATDLLTVGTRGVRRAAGIEDYETGMKQDAAGGSFVGGFARKLIPGLSMTGGRGAAEGKRALELEEKLSAIADRRAEKAKAVASIDKQRRADLDAWLKAEDLSQAKQLRNAYQLARIQKDAAKDAMEAQKKLFDQARKHATELQKNLSKGVQGFASMSVEERQGALQVLQKARSGQQLTFDEADKLESIGSRESKRLAERNRNSLSSGRGIEALGEQELSRRLAPIDEQIDAVKAARAQAERGKFSSPKKREQRLSQFDSKLSDLEIQREQTQNQVQRSVAANRSLYTNVFGEDQQAVRASVQRTQQIAANIKQTIEFQASFDSSAKQIAAEVEAKFRQASQDQVKEVMTLLKPVMTKIQTDRMNAASKAAMSGSK